MKVKITAALALVLALPALADEIHFTDGFVQKDCKVLDETIDEVAFQIGGVKQSRPAKDVKQVIYSSPPGAFAKAKGTMASGDYNAAINDFRAAMKSSKEDWVKQQSLLAIAECYLSMGKGPDAQKVYDELLKDHPKTRNIAEARLGGVRALVLQGNVDGAKAALTKAQAEIKQKGLGSYWDLKATLESARIGIATKDWKGALSSYSQIAGNKDFQDLQQEAKVGLARAKFETGDADGAVAEAKKALEPDNLSDDLAARAWMVVGDCLKKGNKTRDAFFAYLRVVVLYPHIVDEAPRAFNEASKAVRGLKDEGGAPRADELLQELKQRYPSYKAS